ncbi:MAG: site-2 protease family protein [Nitrososphaeraceae archaeon]|nr:site-2 protease family protein [Nitrososphaeraceae archaeon]MBV9667285.1 site-2 protease family protein [Nitrososphaeraceae archaeon]
MRLEQQKNKVHVDVKFPLIFIHTPFGLTFFDIVAKTKAARIYARFNTYLMPLITAFALFLIVGSLIALFSNGTARDFQRSVGPRGVLLIPVLNPFFPVTYGLIALIITLVIHEAGHGIVARVHNIRVESTGILLFLGIPVGAFVNIEQELLVKASMKQKSAILTAGALNNMILAAISLITLYFVISTLTPIATSGESKTGVVVMSVNDGSLASKIGLSKESIIQTIAGQKVHGVDDLGKLLRSNLGHNIQITWQDKTGQKISRSISLPPFVSSNKGILGIAITDVTPNPSLVLQRYKSWFTSNPIALLAPPTLGQGMLLVPYSDLMAPKYESNILGSSFPIVANILFWIWFINFNVGIFNALPITFLDGGSWYNSLIESRTQKSKASMVKNASLLLSLIMIGIVIMSIALPYFIR